jgi:hypothetical protein
MANKNTTVVGSFVEVCGFNFRCTTTTKTMKTYVNVHIEMKAPLPTGDILYIVRETRREFTRTGERLMNHAYGNIVRMMIPEDCYSARDVVSCIYDWSGDDASLVKKLLGLAHENMLTRAKEYSDLL